MSFKLIVITPEKNHSKEFELITLLFESGLQLLHVRKPQASEDELRSYLTQIPKKFYKKIVIHSHYKLAKEFNLKGVHLAEKAKKEKQTNPSLKIISTSFHSTAAILKSRRKYEYIFLSPVFDSISKKGYKGNFEIEGLKLLLKKRKNVIALGGVNTKNIEIVKLIGFSGAASIGAVWENKNPIKSYKELVLKIK
ncbi:MAG TPA: thiamine phosphate synthase [Bacteroidia bacterium]|jgi:thiamine-phosphate pyrophosphorylase|nr:thiamine phosphate synthase [Bacteroidia bacterium]